MKWIPISSYQYNDMLEVLPPAAMSGGWFLVGEPSDHVSAGARFSCYRQVGDSCYELDTPITVSEFRAMVKANEPIPDDVQDLPDIKARVLAYHFSGDAFDVTNSYDEVYEISSEPGEYLVLDTDEADQRHDEYLDSLVEELALAQIPEMYRGYFDVESWKEDNRSDRGGDLAGYDGHEHEIRFEGQNFYIYRVG